MAKILLLTAQDMYATAYGARLTREGFEVQHCRTGRQGLSKSYEWSPDVMLLDVVLPGMTGLEVLKSLRDVPWVVKIHVVALIEHTLSDAVLDECRFWGADSVLFKDRVSVEELVRHLHHILEPAQPSLSAPAL